MKNNDYCYFFLSFFLCLFIYLCIFLRRNLVDEAIGQAAKYVTADSGLVDYRRSLNLLRLYVKDCHKNVAALNKHLRV